MADADPKTHAEAPQLSVCIFSVHVHLLSNFLRLPDFASRQEYDLCRRNLRGLTVCDRLLQRLEYLCANKVCLKRRKVVQGVLYCGLTIRHRVIPQARHIAAETSIG